MKHLENIVGWCIGVVFAFVFTCFFIAYVLPSLWKYFMKSPTFVSFVATTALVLHWTFIVCMVLVGTIVFVLLAPRLMKIWIELFNALHDWQVKRIQFRQEQELRPTTVTPIDIGHSGTMLYNPVKDRYEFIPPMSDGGGKKVVEQLYVPTLYELLRYSLPETSIPIGVSLKTLKMIFYATEDEVSGFILGKAGSGKSNTLAIKAVIAVWYRGRVTILDPHLNDPDQSLVARLGASAQFMRFCSGEDMILEARDFKDEYNGRKTTAEKPTTGWEAWYLMVDELTELLEMGKEYQEIAEIIGEVARGGRKFGMFVKVGTQLANAQYTGGSQLRRSQPEIIVHESDAQEAKLILGDSKGAKKVCKACPDLEKGRAFYKGSTVKYEEVAIPYLDPTQNEALAEMLGYQLYGENYYQMHVDTVATPHIEPVLIDEVASAGQQFPPTCHPVANQLPPSVQSVASEVDTKKQDIISTIKTHPEWSDRTIAKCYDVSHTTVGKYRKELVK